MFKKKKSAYYKKSKPIKIYATEKIQIPDNPYNCLLCNKEYNEQNNDINSGYIDEYCRYLGFCTEKCWDELSDIEKHDIADVAFLEGSTHKHEHKFYLKHLKGYK